MTKTFAASYPIHYPLIIVEAATTIKDTVTLSFTDIEKGAPIRFHHTYTMSKN